MTKSEKKNRHRGSRFEDFLAEEGILEAVTVAAQTRVDDWKVEWLRPKRTTSERLGSRLLPTREGNRKR